jgi:hypothetical protein
MLNINAIYQQITGKGRLFFNMITPFIVFKEFMKKKFSCPVIVLCFYQEVIFVIG